jgi:probable HAF family extracellular repeat protein
MQTDLTGTHSGARAPRAARLPARVRRPLLAAATSALALGAISAPALAAAATPPDASPDYAFTTLDNMKDPTFNQLLAVNNAGRIAGYFGSGQAGHPNRGYLLSPPHGRGDYQSENVPGAAQTQVTGLNNTGITVGFSVNRAGANSGFYAMDHRFHTVVFPAGHPAKPAVDQLLGVNDHGRAVGFYTDASGVNHGFAYTISTHRFRSITVAGDTNVTAAAINNLGDVAGFATNSAGTTEAFLKRPGVGTLHLSYPGASATQAFGVNDGDEVVGDYTLGTGSSATTHGFVWAPGLGFANVDDPQGVGATTINGVNDRGTLVGFYTDAAGNTDGLLARVQG